MENRMKNTFVLLVLVALLHNNRAAADVSSVPVTATQATFTPAPDSTHSSTPNSPAVPSTNVHAESDAVKTVANNGSIQIDVFYEALCRDSVDFVQNQLTPVYNKLSKFINVTFVPFAQGNITKLDNSSTTFCKREGECVADQVHACAIAHITDKDKLLKFVNCSLVEGYNSKNKTIPLEMCGTSSNLDKDIVATIKTCSGDNSTFIPLLENYLKLSHDNQVTFVPKIIVNRNYSEDTQKLATTNLMQAICKLIPAADSPTDCKNTGSGSSAVIVGILPLLISVYYFIRMF